MKKRFAAILLTLTLMMSAVAPAQAVSLAGGSEDLSSYAAADENEQNVVIPGEDEGEPDTLGNALHGLFVLAGMKDSQLGSDADCVALADSLGMLDKDDCDAEDVVTADEIEAYAADEGYLALKEALSAETMEPLFVNGMAQPIFPYTTGSVTEGYSNEESDIIRFFVYVETNYDTDGDGKLDLVKALVQLPKAAAQGDYEAATIYEARPYITGCTDLDYDDYDSDYDISKLYNTPDPRNSSTQTIDSWDDAQGFYAEADSSDWYYASPFESYPGYAFMDYEDLDWYDYYLVRGFAVVECGGLGTRGSEGFETCGSDLEIDAFKCVIEWLNGSDDRKAYTDKTATTAIEAYWSNGKVGMTGRSYSGTTQFGLATTGVEGLETIVPVAGIASWYEYTNSQGIAISGVAYTQYLASYCAGRYLDSEAAAEYAKKLGIENYKYTTEYDENIKGQYEKYLNALADQQYELNGDYSSSAFPDNDTWKIRDYTLDAENIQCPALIVHGLNDDNVKTKQFDLMYKAYQEAGVDAKILLHQDGHLTPTYPGGGYVFDIDDSSYDEILNRWFSHYLYGVDNGAEDMPAVTAQDSHNPDKWNYYDSWEAATSVLLDVEADSEATTTITSDYSANGVSNRNWKDTFTAGSTANSVMYTMDVDSDMVIKGSVAVKFSAVADNVSAPVAASVMPTVDAEAPKGDVIDHDNAVDPSKMGDMDYGIALLAEQPISERDALMVSAMLVDLGPAEGGKFKAINTSGSYVKKELVEKDGAWMGGGLDNLDLKKLVASDVDYKIIARGWMDLCNPDAGYDSASAATRVAMDGTTYHDYTLYLQPNLYTVEEGHQLALVIYCYEPGKASYAQNYAITLKDNSVCAEIPVNGDYTVAYSAGKGGSVTGNFESGVTVVSGTEITLTAEANSGYRFSYWMVNNEKSAETDTTLKLTANQDLTVKAVFSKNSSSGGSAGSAASASYAVTVADTDNGTASASVKKAEAGDTVTVTVKADAGYALASVKAVDKNGNAMKMVDKGNGTYTFTMPASNVEIQAAFNQVTAQAFADVPASAYYAKAVEWAVKNGITGGVTQTTFAPNASCTRAQIVTFLWRAAGCPAPKSMSKFVDVPADAYYAQAVAWAVENGITGGVTETTFAPNASCTRAQAVTFLFRYAAVQGMDAVTLQELLAGYGDAAQVPAYAVSAMNWALGKGIMQGTDGSVMPNASCTRAQIVTFLYRLLGE